ncbi:MAG: ABC transporter ATP-binding protein [Planctomycetota bacterium]
MENAVETRGLAKTYKGGIQALKPLDLEIPAGTRFGLLGPNGAGKSTLVKSLLSIVHATSGSASLLGRDFRDPESRQGVGYLPEGHRFPRYLTGAGVCHYFGRLAGLSGAHLKQETEAKLRIVGMQEWADTKISKYSKGMNQRVGLAQAMLGDPRLIFLDEPTDGVDPKGRREIRDVIAEIANRGATVFFNSHLLSEVEVICDKIAILNKGVLVKIGTVDEIKTAVSGKRTGLQVAFRCGAIPSDLAERLRDRGAALATSAGPRGPETRFSIGVAAETEIDGLIDLLRSSGVSISSVRPDEVNLEDAFIDLISSQTDGADA